MCDEMLSRLSARPAGGAGSLHWKSMAHRRIAGRQERCVHWTYCSRSSNGELLKLDSAFQLTGAERGILKNANPARMVCSVGKH